MASAAQSVTHITPGKLVESPTKRLGIPSARVIMHPSMRAEIAIFNDMLLAEAPMPASGDKKAAAGKPVKKDDTSDYVREIGEKFEREEHEENRKYLKGLELKLASSL
ncbi:hypothetical protein H0O02_01630 [Candidatus Micrarchaeota archaeon]|nr:hypothetical protein [Candidatus Micrarchaeota archaeon]